MLLVLIKHLGAFPLVEPVRNLIILLQLNCHPYRKVEVISNSLREIQVDPAPVSFLLSIGHIPDNVATLQGTWRVVSTGEYQ
jgi:hypothetical protein